MQAVIFAGGKGDRMKKQFPHIQKCMLPVAGKPALQYQIEWLKKNDVKDIIIYVCHKKKQIMDYFKDGKRFNVNITYFQDKVLRSTADHLNDMAHLLDSTFLVIYGDQVILNVDLIKLQNLFNYSRSFITFVTHDDIHLEDSDRITIDDKKKVIGFGDIKGKTYAGIFMAKKKILEFIDRNGLDLSKDVIPKIINCRNCYSYNTTDYIKDIGTPKRYQEAIGYLNKDFKVLFVYPNMYTPYAFSPAIQMLSALLKQKRISTGLVHINDEYGIPDDNHAIIYHILSHSPKVIAFTATSFEFDRVNELAGLIKKLLPDVPVILGGSHAIIAPNDIESSNFDAFCIGEGEKVFVEFIMKFKHNLPYHNLKSMWFKNGKDIIRNPIGSICMDLDNLPFLDLDIMDTENLIRMRHGWFSISMSRGCPFECSYCINHIYKRIKSKNMPMHQYLRKRSQSSIITELEDITKRYRAVLKTFNFDDDLVMLYKDWMHRFATLYQEHIFRIYNINYVINARADTLTIPLVRDLVNSGCSSVRIGVECGNEQIRNKILNKTISNKQIITAFDNCRSFGLKPEAFIMIGIPTETKKSIKETMKLLIRSKPPLTRLSILYPFKHTKIYDYCKRHNLFRKGFNSKDIFSMSSLKFKNITQTELVRYHMLFAWYLNSMMYPKSDYRQLINKYKKYSAEELIKMRKRIQDDDSKIDGNFKLPHFRLYKRSSYYIEYVDL